MTGLCWLHKNPSLLISGSDNGIIQLYDVGLMQQNRPPSIYRYEDFEHLTSVHINCEDSQFLVSGYSNDVSLYDLKVGKKLQTFKGLHTQHINVLKFANHDPHLFATSSFDKHIKMWDLRQRVERPVFQKTSEQGNVMVCFSPCDRYVLSSAVDNEVRQLLACDGREVLKLEMQPLYSEANYTRSYYLNGSDYIISGSCEVLFRAKFALSLNVVLLHLLLTEISGGHRRPLCACTAPRQAASFETCCSRITAQGQPLSMFSLWYFPQHPIHDTCLLAGTRADASVRACKAWRSLRISAVPSFCPCSVQSPPRAIGDARNQPTWRAGRVRWFRTGSDSSQWCSRGSRRMKNRCAYM